MNIFDDVNEKINIEIADVGSSESRIKEMIMSSPIEIPSEYVELIREKSEIEISINEKKVLRIWGADGCVEMNEAYNIQKYLPYSWAIGDDEGGYVIIYAKDENDIGLYAVSFSDLDDNEKIYIAPSLCDFLIKGVGIDIFLSF